MGRNVYATFSPVPANVVVAAGGIGTVTQGGALGGYAYSMARERRLGLSHWISTGNEADIDVADCIEWLAGDTHTRVIMAHMEGCRDGASHAAALAGDDAVYNALFRQHGALRARTDCSGGGRSRIASRTTRLALHASGLFGDCILDDDRNSESRA